MARIHEMGREQRVAELVAPRQDLANIDTNAVTYGGQVVEVGGLSSSKPFEGIKSTSTRSLVKWRRCVDADCET